MPRPDKLIIPVVVGVGIAAVVRELRKPPQQRHWHGRVAGVVPYDFRRPTLQRLWITIWNPDGDHVIVPHAFGVGWSINAGRIYHLLARRGPQQREQAQQLPAERLPG